MRGRTLSVDLAHMKCMCDSHNRKTAGGGRGRLFPNAREEDSEGMWQCRTVGRDDRRATCCCAKNVACCVQRGGGRNKRFKKYKKKEPKESSDGAQKRPREETEAAPAKRAKTE